MQRNRTIIVFLNENSQVSDEEYTEENTGTRGNMPLSPGPLVGGPGKEI